ncbi:pyrroloquinoline quinone biosynthesis peptide chaperone PqqD [Oceanicella sp. SM1341]|uniref:pyrroloquinoline quinone biosynthesis peptide chaperone PqqD n=1 Tax=Oceanicella sp. SM1341 TaxID=1548889 RepID=UPI000E4774D9|nr:pyrroloquinoline quinone biosynthesis peptide chaperone PqqD [Oceanicella sp. SM1341]
MSDAPAAEATLPDAARPRLLRGVRVKHDAVRGMDVLLAPERALKLDPIGAAILAEVDGTRSFAEIVARLAARYNAPAEQISGDARTFLVSLIERRMAEAA